MSVAASLDKAAQPPDGLDPRGGHGHGSEQDPAVEGLPWRHEGLQNGGESHSGQSPENRAVITKRPQQPGRPFDDLCPQPGSGQRAQRHDSNGTSVGFSGQGCRKNIPEKGGKKYVYGMIDDAVGAKPPAGPGIGKAFSKLQQKSGRAAISGNQKKDPQGAENIQPAVHPRGNATPGQGGGPEKGGNSGRS